MNAAKREAAASILRQHFATEASDAGLRSLDLSAAGGSGARSYDAVAVARAERSRGTHRRVREALKRLSPAQVEILLLAYGCRLRNRDIEDGKSRKALRQAERNWRVRFAEVYGAEGASVLASPLAHRRFREHVEELQDRTLEKPENDSSKAIAQHATAVEAALAKALAGGLIAWLLDAGRSYAAPILADTAKCRDAALDAFAEAYGVRVDIAPRTRSSEKTRARILASSAIHGHEIGE